jgi:hypothetical protein
VLDESDLQWMTPEERARLARALASLNAQGLTPTPLSQRRRQLLIAACLAGVVLLSVWIAVLEINRCPRSGRCRCSVTAQALTAPSCASRRTWSARTWRPPKTPSSPATTPSSSGASG